MTVARRTVAWLPVVLAVLAGGTTPAVAQLPHLDPMPWFTPADSTSRLALEIAVDRGFDSATDWTVNRVLLTAMLPAGTMAAWFLRMPFVSFDTGGNGVTERWPATAGPDQSPTWPGGSRIDGFGQIEAGATGPLGLPLLGPWSYALGIGLPTGTNRAYPWSSTSLPVRLQLRRDLPLGGAWHLWAGGGYLLHMDAAGDQLDSSAFPNGWQLGAELAAYRGRGSSWHAVWAWEDRNTRRSQRVGVRLTWPWTESGTVGLRVTRELENAANRPAQWYVTLSWRFDSPGARTVAAATTAP